MFDVIGKRRWFYLISLLITIPGLFFILLTPFTDAGLQFTIDYTGGTKWEIRFEDPNVTPAQVKAVFAEQGLEASAVSTGSGFIEIKTVKTGRLPRGRPVGAAVGDPERIARGKSGRAGAERVAGGEWARPRRARARQPQRERQPVPERLTRRRAPRRPPRPQPATRRSRPRARSVRSRRRSRPSSARSPSSAA